MNEKISIDNITDIIGSDCLSAHGIADMLGIDPTLENLRAIEHTCWEAVSSAALEVVDSGVGPSGGLFFQLPGGGV